MRLLGLTALVVFVLDQLSKLAVIHGLNLPVVGRVEVIPPFLTFQMAWNQGMNFGLFAGDANVTKWLLVIIALSISGWVLWWMRKPGHTRTAQISAGLLIGGALGNVIDRLLYGAVADFLNMSCCGIDNPYAFNVADIAIFLGAIGLVVFTGEPKPPKKRVRKST
ncbi:signal peptidase II [Falsirhodobacter sp. alg1]|uniref:signal peptidase II n=1 Tax=Falsirhodobacter sp. alg1 TaxID=1472418 RepID=UPI0007869435|nr:signal peptidase II [Falsirhodobacter sp. alg1]